MCAKIVKHPEKVVYQICTVFRENGAFAAQFSALLLRSRRECRILQLKECGGRLFTEEQVRIIKEKVDDVFIRDLCHKESETVDVARGPHVDKVVVVSDEAESIRVRELICAESEWQW